MKEAIEAYDKEYFLDLFTKKSKFTIFVAFPLSLPKKRPQPRNAINWKSYQVKKCHQPKKPLSADQAKDPWVCCSIGNVFSSRWMVYTFFVSSSQLTGGDCVSLGWIFIVTNCQLELFEIWIIVARGDIQIVSEQNRSLTRPGKSLDIFSERKF